MGRTNRIFMAFAKGKESKESGEFKRYMGVAPVFILSVNPDAKELSEIYGRQIETAPAYVGEVEVNGKKVSQVRIDFIVKTDGKKCQTAKGEPIEIVNRITFFIRNEFRMNRDGSKVQVIDKYGRTAWVTQEEYKNHALPSYMTNKFRLDTGYRGCYVGEDELVQFIKAYLCIHDVEEWRDSQIVGLKEEPENYEVMFDHISDWFKGDFTEIREAVNLQPNNEVRVLFGIRTSNDNKQYQTVFTRMFIPMDARKVKAYERLAKEVKDAQENGAYKNTEFMVVDLTEYSTKPTDLNTLEDDDDLPMGEAPNPWGN